MNKTHVYVETEASSLATTFYFPKAKQNWTWLVFGKENIAKFYSCELEWDMKNIPEERDVYDH